jgi:hydroxymethylpyrimidine/phosphomethylpyrimidine kinase
MTAVAPPIVLSIAGFDPGSGAGISADLKTIAAHGCYGLSAITALTVQNTQGVRGVEPVSGRLLRATLQALVEDFGIDAVKIGMLGTAEVASVVADFLEEHRPRIIVLDPVIRSSSGAVLLGEAGVPVLRERLLKLASVVTPNAMEAAELAGLEAYDLPGMREASAALRELGAANVIVTGGHTKSATDVLLDESGAVHELKGEKLESASTHGTGCAFASALACRLVQGETLLKAAQQAKKYVVDAIRGAYRVGKGTGPINHFAQLF